VLHSGRDVLPQGVGGTAPGRDSRACQGRGTRPAVSEGAGAETTCVQVPSSEAVLAEGVLSPQARQTSPKGALSP
jgi:hypothetical protein